MMEKTNNSNFYSFCYSQDSLVQGELNFGSSDNKCKAKDPSHCRVHGYSDKKNFLEATRGWASRASIESLANYISKHDGDPLYKEAMFIIEAETKKRETRENYGIHPDMM